MHVSCLAPRQRLESGSYQWGGTMQEEFERKRGLFDDDLAFIREVKEQETAAAGMDPDTELQTLHKRFSNWKHEFKVSLYALSCNYQPLCLLP